MSCFAVIDTETNWADQVMSIGTVIVKENDFTPVAAKYHILPDECTIGGMYSASLYTDTSIPPIRCCREDAIRDLIHWFAQYDVCRLFAYNASFDRNHLPELRGFEWYDIMRLAAYRQFNPKIASAECYASGRMKRGYGVEPMLRILSGKRNYNETHNALHDALDELEIMRLLGHDLNTYIPLA